MRTREDRFAGARAVNHENAVHSEALRDWLVANIKGFSLPLTVEQFKGGQSNPTYKLFTSGRTYVLRRKPAGTLAKSAHAVDREFRVISALHNIGFPVPRVFGLCTDESVIGSWFYVMEYVPGRVFWDASFPTMEREMRPRYFDEMNETLARLHMLKPDALALGDYGRPSNYFERQISRWSRQYEADIEAAGRLIELDQLIQWLPAHIPPGEESSIVHGDFRCDNLIFHPSEPKILAVLDWELSTLGHPLADFTYHLMIYRIPAIGLAGLLNVDIAALNIPSESDYIAAYCQRTNRPGIANLGFYMAYNIFRMAAIIHGIKARLKRGTASSEDAAYLCETLEPFAKIAWEQVQMAEGATGGGNDYASYRD